MATPYEATAAGRAAGYGWSLAVINSNGELRQIFAKASSENWSADRFVSQVRNTRWFRLNSDTVRQSAILQKADPATYRARLGTAAAHIVTLGSSMGASLSSKNIARFAADIVTLNWSDDQIKAAMNYLITPSKSGQYYAGAATFQSQVNQIAGDFGENPSANTMAGWVKGLASGKMTQDGIRNYYMALSSSKYPSLAGRLKAGETIRQIAEPYMQSYAKVLEVNPQTIKIQDPSIQRALMGKDAKGQPMAKSVWEFEQDLRKDPRYMKTQQAQDGAMAMGHTVLKDLGIMGN